MTAKLGTGRSFFCIHVFTQHIAKGKASNGKTNSCYDIRHNITSPLLMYLVKSQDPKRRRKHTNALPRRRATAYRIGSS